jgi:hypothetical protein
MGMVARTRPGCVMPCIGYEFNTIAGGYIFFLDLAIFSTRAYVDKYLLTSLALFFSPPTSDDKNRPTMVRGGR